MTQLKVGAITIDVAYKAIRNVHLSVNPPNGKVRISAPTYMNEDAVRLFAISRLGWIKQQQQKLRDQPRETTREFVDRESHYLWGKRYLLKVVHGTGAPSIEVTPRRIVMRVRPDADCEKREDIMAGWYRQEIYQILPALIAKWERRIGVKAHRVIVRRMKTKWGSCNHKSGVILLNTELAKKPRECLEYILVHELIHLIRPRHDSQFFSLMERHVTEWRYYRDLVNQLPVREETWRY